MRLNFQTFKTFYNSLLAIESLTAEEIDAIQKQIWSLIMFDLENINTTYGDPEQTILDLLSRHFTKDHVLMRQLSVYSEPQKPPSKKLRPNPKLPSATLPSYNTVLSTLNSVEYNRSNETIDPWEPSANGVSILSLQQIFNTYYLSQYFKSNIANGCVEKVFGFRCPNRDAAIFLKNFFKALITHGPELLNEPVNQSNIEEKIFIIEDENEQQHTIGAAKRKIYFISPRDFPNNTVVVKPNVEWEDLTDLGKKISSHPIIKMEHYFLLNEKFKLKIYAEDTPLYKDIPNIGVKSNEHWILIEKIGYLLIQVPKEQAKSIIRKSEDFNQKFNFTRKLENKISVYQFKYKKNIYRASFYYVAHAKQAEKMVAGETYTATMLDPNYMSSLIQWFALKQKNLIPKVTAVNSTVLGKINLNNCIIDPWEHKNGLYILNLQKLFNTSYLMTTLNKVEDEIFMVVNGFKCPDKNRVILLDIFLSAFIFVSTEKINNIIRTLVVINGEEKVVFFCKPEKITYSSKGSFPINTVVINPVVNEHPAMASRMLFPSIALMKIFFETNGIQLKIYSDDTPFFSEIPSAITDFCQRWLLVESIGYLLIQLPRELAEFIEVKKMQDYNKQFIFTRKLDSYTNTSLYQLNYKGVILDIQFIYPEHSLWSEKMICEIDYSASMLDPAYVQSLLEWFKTNPNLGQTITSTTNENAAVTGSFSEDPYLDVQRLASYS